MFDDYKIKPIGYIKSEFKEKFGIPRQSGRAPSTIATIIFNKEYRGYEAFKGLENFSHIWIIFDFSLSHTEKFNATVRPPRLGGNTRVGVFATRSPFRPNNIGLSSVKLEKIEQDKLYGTKLIVSGADLLDGTPIYDIKPYIPFTDCHIDATGSFASENENNKLQIEFINDTKNIIPNNLLNGLIECLSDDPRPSYQEDERQYSMKYSNYDVHFVVQNNILTVIKIDEL